MISTFSPGRANALFLIVGSIDIVHEILIDVLWQKKQKPGDRRFLMLWTISGLAVAELIHR